MAPLWTQAGPTERSSLVGSARSPSKDSSWCEKPDEPDTPPILAQADFRSSLRRAARVRLTPETSDPKSGRVPPSRPEMFERRQRRSPLPCPRSWLRQRVPQADPVDSPDHVLHAGAIVSAGRPASRRQSRGRARRGQRADRGHSRDRATVPTIS